MESWGSEAHPYPPGRVPPLGLHFHPSGRYREGSHVAPVREPQENKGPRLCPGSQPNLQDEYAFISQKFLVQCAKVFFPLQSRQTRQVYFGQPSHHHPGPESLGQGAGTGQIFPLSPQPCNTAHLISPAHPEGNSSSKSCPEFSLWPANSALGVGELLGSGDTSGTPFCIKKREAS